MNERRESIYLNDSSFHFLVDGLIWSSTNSTFHWNNVLKPHVIDQPVRLRELIRKRPNLIIIKLWIEHNLSALVRRNFLISIDTKWKTLVEIEDLDNACVISKVKESETSVDSVEGDPPAKVDSFSNVFDW